MLKVNPVKNLNDKLVFYGVQKMPVIGDRLDVNDVSSSKEHIRCEFRIASI